MPLATYPATLRADLKRPDFLVAISGLSTVAVDAKAKAFIDGYFVLDVSERRRLDGFESEFGMPVWYACFSPAVPHLCYLFRNRALMGPTVIHDIAKQIIRAPVGLGFFFEPASIAFAAALAQADAADRALSARRSLSS